MSALDFYYCEVSHRRFGAAAHRLRYRLAYALVDLDLLEEANTRTRLFGFDKPRMLSVRTSDHGDGRAEGLADWVRDHLAAKGVCDPCRRILLFTLPRMFGYVFNPISVYFIYGDGVNPHHILYEVDNTFGDRHFYLAKVDENAPAAPHILRKAFYVSPFFDVDGIYRFVVEPPDETLSLNIHYRDGAGEKALTAVLRGRRHVATDWRCLKIMSMFPLMTFGVIAAIHWEAFILFLKGVRYRAPSKRQGGAAA